MKLIPLSKNSKEISGKYYAMVDDEDYIWLSQYSWTYIKNKNNNCGYAQGYVGGKNVMMHRLIMGVNTRDVIIDHINRDGLNNQRYNLRLSDYSLNGINRATNKNKTSSVHRGVYIRKGGNRIFKWYASIHINKKKHFLGYYQTESEAALAYNNKAIELYGNYALLNTI